MLLIIKDKEKMCYIAVTKLYLLLRGVTSKRNDDACFLNCLYSFRTEKLQSHKRVSGNKIFMVL